MYYFKNKFIGIFVGVTLIFSLSGCTIHNDVPNKDSKQADAIYNIYEANDNDSIFAEFASVETNTTYPSVSDDFEPDDPMYSYTSPAVSYYSINDGTSNFCYMDDSMMVSNNEDSDCPSYGVIVDEDYYREFLDSYKMIHFFGTKDCHLDYDDTNNILICTDGEQTYSYTLDSDSLLVTDYSCRYNDQDTSWIEETFTYNADTKDDQLLDTANSFIDKISNGSTVKLTIQRLDGSTATFDFPKGFGAMIFSDYSYQTDNSEEYYSDMVIDSDTTLFEVDE